MMRIQDVLNPYEKSLTWKNDQAASRQPEEAGDMRRVHLQGYVTKHRIRCVNYKASSGKDAMFVVHLR